MKNALTITRLAAVGVLAALAGGCDLDLNAASVEGSVDRTFTVNGPADLNIVGGSGSVQVDPGPEGVVHVVAYIKAQTWLSDDAVERVKRIQAAPPIVQVGNTIRVGEIQDTDLFRNISISYEMTVPAATRVRSRVGSGSQTIGNLAGPVDVSTGSGRIRIGEVTGDVHATAGSGSIRVERAGGRLDARAGSGSITVIASGSVAAQTGSGRIDLTQLSQGDVSAKTGSGSIAIAGARGTVHARAGSGAIRIDGQPLDAWDLESASGAIALHVNGEIPFTLEATTGSGGIDVSQPLTITSGDSRRRLAGTVRGGGAQVRLSTGSGGIQIQ